VSGFGRPARFSQECLYRHLVGSDMMNAHSASGDVMGLERILKHPSVWPKWRRLGSGNVMSMTDDLPVKPGLRTEGAPVPPSATKTRAPSQRRGAAAAVRSPLAGP
jgi:hypothetical protein